MRNAGRAGREDKGGDNSLIQGLDCLPERHVDDTNYVQEYKVCSD